MKRSKCMSSQHVFVWHHTHHIWHHIHSLWNHTTLFMTSSPLYLTSHPLYMTLRPLYLCNHTHSINDISATLCVISHTVYMWHTIQYMISYSLCMTTQICVWLIPHSAYVWHHLHYSCYHIHSITPNHNIYDVTNSSGMTSLPLYKTSHSLYLCHHNLSTDIIPTFVWHHTHYMDDNICTLHNIISIPYVITLLYLCHHSLYIWNHIQHVGPHIHYTCDIRATNLCHHSHSIENITHALYDLRLE